MRIVDDLDPVQIRVLGALLEKEQATPEYYPLTVNALLQACNQKSNRDPVTRLTETEVIGALDSLAVDTLVWRSDGARVERWKQSISRRLELDAGEKAALTLLMLRGPQTAGELRSRSGRLYRFADIDEVHAALTRMASEGRELVTELPRRPGQKENRWQQLLGGGSPTEGASASEAVADSQPSSRSASLSDRVAELEKRVETLEAELGRR